MKLIDNLLVGSGKLLGIVNQVDNGSIDVGIDDDKSIVVKIIVEVKEIKENM